MFTVDELSQKIADYRSGRISLEQFDDWFEDNSIGAYAVRDPGLREAYAAVEASFARYYFDHTGEPAMKAELAKAIRPFVSWPESLGTVYRVPPLWLSETAAMVGIVLLAEDEGFSAVGHLLATPKRIVFGDPSEDAVSTSWALRSCVQPV